MTQLKLLISVWYLLNKLVQSILQVALFHEVKKTYTAFQFYSQAKLDFFRFMYNDMAHGLRLGVCFPSACSATEFQFLIGSREYIYNSHYVCHEPKTRKKENVWLLVVVLSAATVWSDKYNAESIALSSK